jgi:hypothetical protein
VSQRKGKSTRTDRPILELRARGPGVRPGRVPVPDLIRICEEAQKAVNRQAEALEGRKTLHPGPISDQLRQECTLELIGIKRGSTRLQFGLARSQTPIPFPDQATFGEDVIGELAKTIKSLGNDNKREADPGVLQALYGLSSFAQRKKISEIEWIAPKSSTRKKIIAPLTLKVHDRVAVRLSAPRKAQRQVDGILDMADFKPDDLRCRIDPAIGAPVTCTFDERNSTEVQLLIRQAVRVCGEATIAPYSDRVESLHIQKIERLPSLSLGKDNFFAESSLSELVSAQKVKPIKDMSSFASGFPEEEDIDAFLEEIYAARK